MSINNFIYCLPTTFFTTKKTDIVFNANKLLLDFLRKDSIQHSLISTTFSRPPTVDRRGTEWRVMTAIWNDKCVLGTGD